MAPPNTTPLFPLGQVVAPPGALEALQAGQSPLDVITRHVQGDWGDVCEHDRTENERSLREGFRLMSVYTLKNGEKLWIITEADRSATTLLLPHEYDIPTHAEGSFSVALGHTICGWAPSGHTSAARTRRNRPTMRCPSR
jgi:hypothetical protein